MIDWYQFARNVLFGAVHQPLRLVRWSGNLLTNEAAPIGEAIVQAANEVDAAMFTAFGPPGYLAEAPPA